MGGPATGATAGAALSAHIAKTIATVRSQLSPIEQGHRIAANTANIEAMERELAPIVSAIIDALTAHGDVPLGLGDLLGQARDPEHQVSFIGQIGVLISAVFVLAFQMGQPLARDAMNTVYTFHQHENIPLGAIAELAARGWISLDFAHSQAANQGYSYDKVDAMIAASYVALSPQQVNDAVNRGAIAQGDIFDHFRHAGVAPAEMHVWDSLRVQRADPGSAIAAVVQSHLTPDQAATVLRAHGIDTNDLGWLVDTAGRPPGVFELGELVNRGELSEDEWQQAIRESDIKNKYIPALMNLRFRIPPERSVVSMMRKGGITPQQGATWLHQLGYHPDAITALVAEATEDKLQAHKDLNVSMVTEGYELRLLDYGTAHTDLMALGYNSAEADYILSVRDHKRELTIRNQAVGAIRSHYVSHKIDRSEASRELDALLVPSAERDQLVAAWDLELKGNVRLPSEAQLAAWLVRGLITEQEYRVRLAQMGYQPDDVNLYVRYRNPT